MGAFATFPNPATMSWPEIIGGALVLGGVALLSEVAFRDRIGGGGRLLYLVIALPLSSWTGQYAGLLLEQVAPPLFASTPATSIERASLRLHERLDHVPEWQQRTRGLSQVDKDKLGFELSGKGAARLDDEFLPSLAAWLREALAGADVPTCAALLRGTATPAELRHVLEKLDPASLEAYMDASFNAIVAELKGVGARKVTSEEHTAAFNALIELVPKDWRPPLIGILGMPRFRSDEEVCWAGRTVTYYMGSLPDRHQRAVLLALVR